MSPLFQRARQMLPSMQLMQLRQLIVLALDGAIAAASLWLAMLLRFEGNITESYLIVLPAFMIILVGYRILSSILFRLHRWSFRFSGLPDSVRVAAAGLFGTGLFLGTFFLIRHPGPPRSVVVLELLISTLIMSLIRYSPRLAGMYMKDWARSRSEGSLRTLIFGAGSAGELLLRDLQRSQDHSYQVIGLVDDDRSKLNMVVGGKTVLGGLQNLRQLVTDYRISDVLIAVPRLRGSRVREILASCADLKLRFKILPVSYIYLQEHAVSSALQDLSPEDLLHREPVTFIEDSDSTAIDNRSTLVTGAAGSIGGEICTQLLRAKVGRLVMVDINENGLYLLKRRLERLYPDMDVSLEIADIRDKGRMRSLFEQYRPQDVFHAAAHKHVPLMESAPCEAIKNNVMGTRNVARAADHFKAERFIYISTDKAVRPTSVMGATKRLGEELVRNMARSSDSRFCAVRFGNVLGSAGSVVPIFREQIAAGGPVSVTHPDVRRYFMTISEAVSLVLKATYGDYGELCVLDMGEQIKIVDLARHMITMAGLVPDHDISIAYTGLRPGEKLFEELLTEEEERTHRVTEKIFVASCPPPPSDLDRLLDDLAEAADREAADEVRKSLKELIPSYVTLDGPPAAEYA